MAPPEVAYAHDWMALSSTGADRFVKAHPTFDGRGVLIAILDTGIDPGVPGLITTSTGNPKLVDVRDFSGEGSIPLERVTAKGDTVVVAGKKLGGFSRVVGLSTSGPYYGGSLRERDLGALPASDLNGDSTATDTLALVVTRATDGWVLLADTDGDGSLAGERPVHDYQASREFFGWAPRGRAPRANVAATFTNRGGEPALDLVLALDSHGTHVAGIAAANDLYRVSGFDGVAPGAQLLGLKISNRANGSVSTSGAIVAAMDYAIRYAAARRMPLVINLSFGVGNEREGYARIDQLLDSVLGAHPEIPLTVSAGNDGPALSTVGFPGSASRAISVGGTLPASFLPPSRGGSSAEPVADFSARGGETAKPDILAPGVAYSSVPLWNAGEEVKQGTSMAAPHAAGLVALLLSGLGPEQRPDGRTVRQALMVTAHPAPGAGFLDQGRGEADVDAAFRWLSGGGRASPVELNVVGQPATGAWVELKQRGVRTGIQKFQLHRPAGEPPATYQLRSDATWLTGPASVTLSAESTLVELRYNAAALEAPGAYTGVVAGWPADTMAGPAFRLVTTVVIPASTADTAVWLRRAAAVESGQTLRSFFRADSARPLLLQVSASPGQRGLSYLHEPGGAPFRDDEVRPLGVAEPGEYQVDARDVVAGDYQLVASPMPGGHLSLTAVVSHAPVTIGAGSEGETARADLTNVTNQSVSAKVELRLTGAQRRDSVSARGSAVQRIGFDIPSWAAGVQIDVAMDRKQWERFTDFGVTLIDAAGGQIAQSPLQYAFGRLSTEIPETSCGARAELVLFPGFADANDGDSWSLSATIRMYADSAVAVSQVQGEPGQLTVLPRKKATARFALPASPWPLPAGFSPLGVVLVRIGDEVWTRESGFEGRSAR